MIPSFKYYNASFSPPESPSLSEVSLDITVLLQAAKNPEATGYGRTLSLLKSLATGSTLDPPAPPD